MIRSAPAISTGIGTGPITRVFTILLVTLSVLVMPMGAAHAATKVMATTEGQPSVSLGWVWIFIVVVLLLVMLAMSAIMLTRHLEWRRASAMVSSWADGDDMQVVITNAPARSIGTR